MFHLNSPVVRSRSFVIRNRESLNPKKNGGFKRAAGFYLVDGCMYPISIVRDSLRNGALSFDATTEAGTRDSLDVVRTVVHVSTTKAKMPKYIKVSLVILGLGLLSVVVFRGVYSTGAVASTESPPQALSCQYMTVSLIRGKLAPGPQGEQPSANVPCTPTILPPPDFARAHSPSPPP